MDKTLEEKFDLNPPIAKRASQTGENELNYQLLINSVKDYAIFMLGPEGHIRSWNPGAERLKGYSKEEILGKHFSIFYTEKDLQTNHPAYELKIARKEGRYEEEGWRVKKDGSLFWANVVITAIYTADHQLAGFSKVTRDLTERKILEDRLMSAYEELKESEERSRLLISGVKDYAIFMLTTEGYVASWNDGAQHIKGYKAEEIIGQHFSFFYPSEARDANFPNFELEKALAKGKFEDEGWRIKKDGSKFWANVVITPVFNAAHEHIGFTKITRDLSERVRNEELMQKNQELHQLNTDLDNFVYTASHDLKAPISNLEGLLSLLNKRVSAKLNESEKDIVQMMGTSLQKLNNTIESLVEVTKVQRNLDDKLEQVSFSEIAWDIKEDLAGQIAETGAQITEDYQVKEVRFVKSYLRSILYNLLSNAIKYRSEKRPAHIQLRTYAEGDKIVLRVKDNGLGLSKAQTAKLFTMFRRFHSHVKGTGIGLYIVKRIMENNRGTIRVQSQEGAGTEFTLYFQA